MLPNEYCEGVKSTCLGAGRWQVAKRQVAKKLMESVAM